MRSPAQRRTTNICWHPGRGSCGADGIMVSRVGHFAPIYFDQYREALETIAKNG